jgi:hypothetical protein
MRLLLIAIIFGSLCVACGGDDGSPTDTADSSSTSTTSATPASSTVSITTTSVPNKAAKPGAKTKPTLDADSSLSTVGLDSVTFGMTAKQAQRAAGTKLIPESTPNTNCYWLTAAKAPDGIRFMVSEGTIERIDIVGGPITTRSGVGIGTPVERVVEFFGDQIDPSEDGRTLTFVPSDESDAEFRVIFETDGAVVTSLRSGRIPQIRWTDCGT